MREYNIVEIKHQLGIRNTRQIQENNIPVGPLILLRQYI